MNARKIIAIIRNGQLPVDNNIAKCLVECFVIIILIANIMLMYPCRYVYSASIPHFHIFISL